MSAAREDAYDDALVAYGAALAARGVVYDVAATRRDHRNNPTEFAYVSALSAYVAAPSAYGAAIDAVEAALQQTDKAGQR